MGTLHTNLHIDHFPALGGAQLEVLRAKRLYDIRDGKRETAFSPESSVGSLEACNRRSPFCTLHTMNFYAMISTKFD